jgi:hypothetical protein
LVTFYVANNLEEAKFNENYLSIPEGLHLFFCDEFKFDNRMKIITELSFYCDEILIDKEKINVLLELSNKFEIYDGKNKNKVKLFFKKLEALCNKSIEENKLLIAIGD